MLQDPRRDVRYQNSYGYMDAMRKWPVQKQYIVKSESPGFKQLGNFLFIFGKPFNSNSYWLIAKILATSLQYFGYLE